VSDRASTTTTCGTGSSASRSGGSTTISSRSCRGVQQKLEQGVDVADVGTERGWPPIRLAQAFPNSRFVGYDAFEPTIDRARKNAEDAGVADRAGFEHLDASKSMPEKYDIITTFDVVHDAADPQGLLRTIRDALKPDGTHVCLHQLLRQARGERGPARGVLPRRQHHVLHDHVARERR
jgi:2-polyprenyl-3-methyl-5-hydroxy-6-metoxy-1,4-benzoquinol methylase